MSPPPSLFLSFSTTFSHFWFTKAGTVSIFPFCVSLSIFKLERTMGRDFLSAFHPSQSFTFSLLCSLLIFLHFSIFTSFLFPLFQFLPHTLYHCFILHSLPLLHHLSPVSIHSSSFPPPSVGSNHPSPFSPFKVTLSVVCSFN